MFALDYTSARATRVFTRRFLGKFIKTNKLTDSRKALRLLARADHPPVAVGSAIGRVTAAEAALLIERGEYVFRFRRSRVRHMARVGTRSVAWQACHRTCSSPTLQPSIEWVRRVSAGPGRPVAA